MNAALHRVIGGLLVAWALSPVVPTGLWALDSARRSDRSGAADTVTWSLDSGAAHGAMPTPDAPRSALRGELPSGRALYQGLGRLHLTGPGGRRDEPVLFIELADADGATRFAALRGPFVGPRDPALTDALAATLGGADRTLPLVRAHEAVGGLTLAFEGGPAYAAASLVGAIEVRD